MKKRNEGNGSNSDTGESFYLALELADEAREELISVAADLHRLDQRSTEQVFRKGELLESAAKLLPDTTIEKWARLACGYTGRSVRTYRAIHRNLAPYKREFVDLAVGATVLGKLSSAEPDQIDDAIAFAKEHGRLQVADVTAIIDGVAKAGDDKEDKNVIFNIGGIDGLKAVAAAKIRIGAQSFSEHCALIIKRLKDATAGKKIKKAELVRAVFADARLARAELESLVFFVEPNPHVVGVVWPLAVPASTNWHDVHRVLEQLGGLDGWPDANVLREWIDRRVVPALSWAISREKAPHWAATRADVSGNMITDTVAPQVTAGFLQTLGPTVLPEDTVVIENPEPDAKIQIDRKRTRVAAPPTSQEDFDEADAAFEAPAFLRQKRPMTIEDLPTIEEASSGAGLRMR